jgi:CubicO group peptidase (beta-lactamase class C family)
MRPVLAAAVVVASLSIAGAVTAQRRVAPAAAPVPAAAYFPGRFDWQHKQPEEVGMDAARVADAVKSAVDNESTTPKDQALMLAESFGRNEPFDAIIGPTKTRAAANGIITRHGYIVAEWGDTSSADMTHSVTKTFLTTVIGLAWQRGLIHDVHDYARAYMPPGVDLFDAPHNQKITWDDLLRQTSDWQGTLWGNKYNDVRVNAMALAALEVWRRPLPDVLRREVMEPIGASSTWRWYGYENSWVEVDGQKVQSMTGGGHWGGGMFINAFDMARFGYLFLRHGTWHDKEIVSKKWIEMARTPGPANAHYGFANWFLNTGGAPLTNAPETAVYFEGNGANIIYIDWDHDIVAVVRWIRGTGPLNEFIGKMLAAITTQP